MDAKLQDLTDKVLQGEEINRQEAEWLTQIDIEELAQGADRIRQERQQDEFDMCSVISIKGGRCSEDCKYCAQSAHYTTKIETYPLLNTKPILEEAQYNYSKGVARYAVVTSGKRLSDEEIDKLANSLDEVHKKCKIKLCVSGGLLNEAQFKKLNDVGVERIHNNLETSRNHFDKVCTTHTFEDKVEAIKAAQRAGMSVCSGGIMGIGETMEDRIDMALYEI